MSKQLELPIVGDYSNMWSEEMCYQEAVASSEMCHAGIGWVWVDRLHTKKCSPDLDEAGHFALFGYEMIDRSRFRGWFNKGILVARDREGRVTTADDIPQQLYNHLMRKFNVSATNIRVL